MVHTAFSWYKLSNCFILIMWWYNDISNCCSIVARLMACLNWYCNGLSIIKSYLFNKKYSLHYCVYMHKFLLLYCYHLIVCVVCIALWWLILQEEYQDIEFWPPQFKEGMPYLKIGPQHGVGNAEKWLQGLSRELHVIGPQTIYTVYIWQMWLYGEAYMAPCMCMKVCMCVHACVCVCVCVQVCICVLVHAYVYVTTCVPIFLSIHMLSCWELCWCS